MSDTITGGCKCGAARYAGEAYGGPGFRCYCRDCQQLTGTGHTEMLPLAADSFEIVGTVTEYEMEGGSGLSTCSVFCPVCGSPLMRRSARMSDRVYVHAGSLDDPRGYRPGRSIFFSAAQPWDRPQDSD